MSLLQSIANPVNPSIAGAYQRGQVNQQVINANNQAFQQSQIMNPLQAQAAQQNIAVSKQNQRQQQQLFPSQLRASEAGATSTEQEANARLLQNSAYDLVALAGQTDENQSKLIESFGEKYAGTPIGEAIDSLKLLGPAERNKKIGEGIATFQMMGLLPVSEEIQSEIDQWAKSAGIQKGTKEYQELFAGALKKKYLNEEGPDTVVNVGGAISPFVKTLGQEMAKEYRAEYQGAKTARESLQYAESQLKILNEGMISGFGADVLVTLGRGLQRLGFDKGKDAVDNAITYAATAAQETGRIIQLFGAGTGLSDADREFALKAAAGDINMTEGAIRRILLINSKAAWNVIQLHNEKTASFSDDIKTHLPFATKVDLPENFRAPDWFLLHGKDDDVLKSSPNPNPRKANYQVLQNELQPNEHGNLGFNRSTGQFIVMRNGEPIIVPIDKVPVNIRSQYNQ